MVFFHLPFMTKVFRFQAVWGWVHRYGGQNRTFYQYDFPFYFWEVSEAVENRVPKCPRLARIFSDILGYSRTSDNTTVLILS